jgi:ABC-type antimicrobial peptide transport system permease subunit
MTIVGVVTDIRTSGPANPVMPQVYSPFSQNAFPVRSIMVLARGNSSAIRHAVAAIDADAAVHEVRSMRERLALNTARPRFQTTILALFALMAALIAVSGIAAVVAYSVTQRTREAGVRMAVGATRAQVFALMVRDGMSPVLAGIAAGFMLAMVCSDVLEGMLFEVTALDGVAWSAAALAFATAALIGCAAAARGVTRVDPISALRVE